MFLDLENVQTKKALVTVICVFVYLNVGCFVEKSGYKEMLVLVKGSTETWSRKLHGPLSFPRVSDECPSTCSKPSSSQSIGRDAHLWDRAGKNIYLDSIRTDV